MEEGTSGADRALPIARVVQRFRRIVVIGGGCYGSYYVRQLRRAADAGAITWSELVVVDRDPECTVAMLPDPDLPDGLHVQIGTWEEYLFAYLDEASRDPASVADDAIVPSPLMPHLLAQWLMSRAVERWPGRAVEVAPLAVAPEVPWQMTGADKTHYVSFAEWVCPINCIEPARCPATKGDRSWSLPIAIAGYVADERRAGRPLVGPFVFHCSHRAYGVGMIDVDVVVAADAAIADRGAGEAASFLVGTASHCHGALQRIEIGPAVNPARPDASQA